MRKRLPSDILRGTLIALVVGTTCIPASAQLAWQPGPSLSTARDYPSVTTLADGRVLVAGGYAAGKAPTATAEIFDPRTRAWSLTGSLNVARAEHTAVRLRDGRVLALAGQGETTTLDSVEIFDPGSGTWATVAPLPYGRGPDIKAVVLRDGRVFADWGGYYGLIYDPVRNGWGKTENLGPWRAPASVTLLADGRVLLAGGDVAPGTPALTGLVWTAATNTWQETGPFLVPRMGHTASLLADGRVLVAGGWHVEGTPPHSSLVTIPQAEVFDPLTLAWTAAGSLADSRVDHSSTLMPDGTVLVAGGTSYKAIGSMGSPLSSVEIFDPATNAFRPGLALSSAQSPVRSVLLPRGEPMVISGSTTEILEPPIWHSWFAVDPLETPYVGDFDGDGRTDIITFTRQNPNAVGDVYVALSDGTKFGANTKWHDWFAITTDEQVVIGDYDGDGKDDIATWLGTTTRQAYVALSHGTGMSHETVWADGIGSDPSDVLLAGDTNDDGKDDLVCFARKQGKVYVALSTGSRFETPKEWHAWFAVSTSERPRVADVNGDGKADIVTFATDSPTAQGDVYVAISDGTKFTSSAGVPNNSTKWHDWFAVQPSEQVRIGNVDGDAMQDFFTFLPPPFAQCYTVRSEGTQMGPNVLWPEPVAPAAGDAPYVGDVNGDKKADVIVFAQREGKVYVSLGR